MGKNAHHALREVAFLKNRASFYIVLGLIILAAIGMAGSLLANPAGFLQRIAVVVLIGAAIYFVVKRFYLTKPEKREQRAFVKAAKKSKKRLQQQKDSVQNPRRSGATITSMKKTLKTKKKPSAHLTVIEGKKGKKKNRASF